MRLLLGLLTGVVITGATHYGTDQDRTIASNETTFTHVALVVEDMPLMRDFYGRVLGLTELRHGVFEDSRVAPATPGARAVTGFDELLGLEGVRLEAAFFGDASGRQVLELIKLPDHPSQAVDRALNRPLGLNHLGVRVRDLSHVLSIIRDEELGGVLGGPVTIPEFGGATAAFILDPEGNIVEIAQSPAR